MSITETEDGAVVVTGERDTRFYQLLVWRASLKLEILGLHRHGRSAYSIVKSELGFRGTKASVLVQLSDYIEKKEKERLAEDQARQHAVADVHAGEN
jgi:hypothetical protein